MDKEKHPYADIIDLPHHVSRKHPPLTMRQRAAQFKPFEAVKGHKEAILKVIEENEKKYE